MVLTEAYSCPWRILPISSSTKFKVNAELRLRNSQASFAFARAAAEAEAEAEATADSPQPTHPFLNSTLIATFSSPDEPLMVNGSLSLTFNGLSSALRTSTQKVSVKFLNPKLVVSSVHTSEAAVSSLLVPEKLALLTKILRFGFLGIKFSEGLFWVREKKKKEVDGEIVEPNEAISGELEELQAYYFFLQ